MIEAYLSRDENQVRCWEAGVFNALAHPFGNSLVLYGAGKLGRSTCAKLRRNRVAPLAFSDQNPSLWGTTIDGLPVLRPEEAARAYGAKAAFVVTIWNFEHRFEPTASMLRNLGCARVVPCPALFYKYPGDFLPYFSMDLPHKILAERDRLRQAYEAMGDERSREEFERELRWRMDLDFSGPPPMGMSDHHFPTDLLQLSGEEVLFDCGAYDGDTLLQFLSLTHQKFERIVAFEPDPVNYEKLAGCVGKLPPGVKEKVELHKVAVGARAEVLRFNAEGRASSGFDPGGSVEVECRPLDDFLGKSRPTYIKMDIEGAEPDALRGGDRLIRQATPVLAVCVYHCPDHLWEIPLAVRALSPAYSLYLRRYAEIPWELVCYGIP